MWAAKAGTRYRIKEINAERGSTCDASTRLVFLIVRTSSACLASIFESRFSIVLWSGSSFLKSTEW
jgi:hypothetical protein